MKDLLEDAARADETLLYVEDNELSRLLWKSVGNADIAEETPQINEDLVGLRKPNGSAAGALSS